MIHKREEGRAVITVDLDAHEVEAIAPAFVENLAAECRKIAEAAGKSSWTAFPFLNFDPVFRVQALLADLNAARQAGEPTVELHTDRDWFREVLAAIVRDAARRTLAVLERPSAPDVPEGAAAEAARLYNTMEILDRIGWPQDGHPD